MWSNLLPKSAPFTLGNNDKDTDTSESALEDTNESKVPPSVNVLKNRFVSVLERTSEAVHTVSKTFDTHHPDAPTSSSPTSTNPTNLFSTVQQSLNDNLKRNEHKRDEMLASLRTGWGSVVEATRHAVETTKEVVEKEQTRLQAGLFRGGRYTRDISLPLDTEALCDAEVVYITDRLITMSHPALQSPTDGDITSHRKLAAVSHLLHKRHHGRYMVWNLSELDYDFTILDDQVMTFRFPGSPSPPLGQWLKIIMGMESWLKADSRNVVVVHCLTGRGRTSTTLAAFLCWMGEAGFGLNDTGGGVFDTNGALEYIARCKRTTVERLTIPSQRRYVTYFKNMLDGIKPSQPPLLLKRVIMSESPRFGKCPKPHKQHLQESNTEHNHADNNNNNNNNDSNSVHSGTSNPTSTNNDSQRAGQLGCAPYLQIFKGGQLVFTTAASRSYNQSKDDLPFCLPSDGPITFPIETVVQGDILVRCRHLTRKGQRLSMFRAAVHTGYIPPKVLRLTKSQLDGACHDARYADDFFIDLIFEECDAAMASKHILSGTEDGVEGAGDGANDDGGEGRTTTHEGKHSSKGIQNENIHNEAAARRMMGTIAGSEQGDGNITASAYDSMLHRDSRFWDIIAAKKEQNLEKKNTPIDGNADIPKAMSQFYGPTIGRRREFAQDIDGETEDGSTVNADDGSVSSSLSQKQKDAINTFSIGGELDFTEEGGAGESGASAVVAPKTTTKKVPKKDDLMDALMAIDNDLDGEHDLPGEGSMDTHDEPNDPDMEEIVFDATDDGVEKGTGDTVTSSSMTRDSSASSLAQDTSSNKTDAGGKEGASAQELVSASGDTTDAEDQPSTTSLDENVGSVQVQKAEGYGQNSDADVEEDLGAGENYDFATSNADADAVDDADGDSFDFDEEDEDLEDLENFLMKAKDK